MNPSEIAAMKARVNDLDYLFKGYRSMKRERLEEKIEEVNRWGMKIDPLEILHGEGLIKEIFKGHYSQNVKPVRHYFDSNKFVEL